MRRSIGLFGRAFRMFRGVRVSEYDRPLVNAGHCFDDLLSKSLSLRADTDDGSRLEILNHGDEVSRRRVRMGVRPLEIEQVSAARLERSIYVEMRDTCARLIFC